PRDRGPEAGTKASLCGADHKNSYRNERRERAGLARADPGCSHRGRGSRVGCPFPSPFALSAGHVQVHLVEVDGDVTRCVSAQMERLVCDEVRAVASGQVVGVGSVLKGDLVLERLSEPGRKVAAACNGAWIIGRIGKGYFV